MCGRAGNNKIIWKGGRMASGFWRDGEGLKKSLVEGLGKGLRKGWEGMRRIKAGD
jgi:hypothetical protein